VESVTISSHEPLAEDGTRPEKRGANIPGAPVGSLLLQVIRAHARVGTHLLSESSLVSPQELVLLHLEANGAGAVAQTDLVHHLDRDRSTVTATLQVMERGGLVTRVPSQSDRRTMTVELTPKGRDAARYAQRAWEELERRTTRTLTVSQQQELLSTLAAVRDGLNETLLTIARPARSET
jgi:DNA-binding MarR family transcriptional regulator